MLFDLTGSAEDVEVVDDGRCQAALLAIRFSRGTELPPYPIAAFSLVHCASLFLFISAVPNMPVTK